MKCSQLLFGTVSLSVVVLLYLTTSSHCEVYQIKTGHYLVFGKRRINDELLFYKTITTGKYADIYRNMSKYVRFPQRIGEEIYYCFTCLKIREKGVGGVIIDHTSGVLGSGYMEYTIKKLIYEGYRGYSLEFSIWGYKI